MLAGTAGGPPLGLTLQGERISCLMAGRQDAWMGKTTSFIACEI